MEIQPLGKRRLLIYLSGDDLMSYPTAPGSMSKDDAAKLFKTALGEISEKTWENVLLELFEGTDSLLLLARAHSGDPHFFIFEDFEDLITAALRCPMDIVSTLCCCDGMYYLIVYPWDREQPPSVLFEYGEPVKMHPHFALYLSEHGKQLLGPAALDDLKELF